LYGKSEVYRVKRNCENIVPCGVPVLLNTCSDTQPFSLTNCGLFVRKSIIQVIVEVAIFWGFLHKSTDWYVLKALENSRNIILTVLPAMSR